VACGFSATIIQFCVGRLSEDSRFGGDGSAFQAVQYMAGQRVSAHMRPCCGALQILDSSPVPRSMLCFLYMPFKLSFVCGPLVSEPDSGLSRKFTRVGGMSGQGA